VGSATHAAKCIAWLSLILGRRVWYRQYGWAAAATDMTAIHYVAHLQRSRPAAVLESPIKSI